MLFHLCFEVFKLFFTRKVVVGVVLYCVVCVILCDNVPSPVLVVNVIRLRRKRRVRGL